MPLPTVGESNEATRLLGIYGPKGVLSGAELRVLCQDCGSTILAVAYVRTTRWPGMPSTLIGSPGWPTVPPTGHDERASKMHPLVITYQIGDRLNQHADGLPSKGWAAGWLDLGGFEHARCRGYRYPPFSSRALLAVLPKPNAKRHTERVSHGSPSAIFA